MSITLAILSLLLAAAASLYFYSKKKYAYFEERGVKYKPALPFIGSFWKSAFYKEHFIDSLRNLYNDFPGERYVGIFEGLSPVVVVKDPETIKKITVKDFEYFIDHKDSFGIGNNEDALFNSSLIFLKGEKWREMRGTLSPAFTGSKMRLMVPFMSDISKQITEYLHKEIKHSEEGNYSDDLDMTDLFSRYTNDVIASCAFGLNVNSVKDKTNDFYSLGQEMSNIFSNQKLKIFIFSFFPRLAKLLKMEFFPKYMTAFFRRVVCDTMKYRQEHNVHRPDMINLLMEAKNGTLKNSSPKTNDGLGFATVEESNISAVQRKWTDVELAAQAFIFFFAGFETSSRALVFTAHELALNPEIQAKLRAEIDLSHAQHPELTYEVLQNLKYMDMVISESLRKWGGAILLDRECKKEYVLDAPRPGGEPYILKPKQSVYILIYGLHMDEKYFPDPEKFDPERFSEERKDAIEPFTYFPFGSGPRNCIGSRFALMELKVVLYQLLLEFELLPGSKTTNPITLENDFSMRIKSGSWLKLKARN